MYFLRNLPVDISRYLPQFLKKDAVMKDLLDAHSWEHEHLRLNINDITNQFFVETATWGLADWERILDIIPNADDDYVQRRNRILLYLQSHQISTVAFLENLIKKYMTADGVVRIKERNPENIFNIFIESGKIKYFDDLREGLETYKPAHLGYNIAMKIAPFFYLNCGGPLIDVITPEKVTVKRVPYVVFTYGLNASGAVETLTSSRTTTTNHSAYLFTSGTMNGRLRLNDTGNYSLEEKDLGQDITERWKVFTGSRLNAKSAITTNDTPTVSRSSSYHIADWQNVVTYHGDTLNGGTGSRKAWTTSKTTTSSEKRFVRPIYALNQLGTLSKNWEDIGSDKTITETVFAGTCLNGSKTDIETKTISTTSSRKYTVFTGARLNGRKNLFLNQSSSEQKARETVTTRTVKMVTFTGALLNGALNLNRGQPKTITRTVHIPVWREVHKRKGGTLLNASRHETRYKEIRTVVTPRKAEKKFNPAIGTLLNGKAVMGYLRLS